eukprot:TRINITY_DN20776_c0_g1_i2.p3 TRINITY_DN20776_c0_g1~~TRINITY_DN20776_c0_g1_i2.p3  ORF type:complete len:151 (+),score=36.72 TRINITY_DN20776_c0_g1_i2:925-1377(+)
MSKKYKKAKKMGTKIIDEPSVEEMIQKAMRDSSVILENAKEKLLRRGGDGNASSDEEGNAAKNKGFTNTEECPIEIDDDVGEKSSKKKGADEEFIETFRNYQNKQGRINLVKKKDKEIILDVDSGSENEEEEDGGESCDEEKKVRYFDNM